jgi:hypothetical protein
MTRNKSGYYEDIEDTKGLSRSRKSEDRHYNGQKCEDTKGVIRSRKSEDRHYNGQKKNETIQ